MPTKSTSLKWIVVLLIILILSCICFFCSWMGINSYFESHISVSNNKDQDIIQPTQSEKDTLPNVIDSTPSTNHSENYKSEIESIYNENIVFEKAERVELSELEMALDILEILDKKNWKEKSDFDISINDFDSSRITRFQNRQDTRNEGLTIPGDLLGIYSSSTAQKEIKDLTFQIRQEYLDYLEFKGVNKKYIDEINNNILPEDLERFTFVFKNSADATKTMVEAFRGEDGKKDFGKYHMSISVIDFHNGARLFRNSNILDTKPKISSEIELYEKQLRDLSMRWYIYHEMTHVLQRSFMNLHAAEGMADTLIPYREETDTLMYTSKNLYWHWGEDDYQYSKKNNLEATSESQSEGISFEILANMYNMSKTQQEATWEHLFGRMNNAQTHLDSIQEITEKNFPNYDPSDLGSDLIKSLKNEPLSEEKKLLTNLSLRLGGMPAYVGYMNPMKPEDTSKFWDALK